MLSKIKKEHQTAFVAFGKSGLPLGQRPDLDDLAIIAHKSKDKSLLQLFEILPSLEQLQMAKTDAALPKITKEIPEVPVSEDPPIIPELPPDQAADELPAPEEKEVLPRKGKK